MDEYKEIMRRVEGKIKEVEEENNLKSKVIAILFEEYYDHLPSAKELGDK